MLDKTGMIIGQSPNSESLAKSQIDLQPIQAFLQPDRKLPIVGDDPKHVSEKSIFSAFPLYINDETTGESDVAGYVYAVVAGQQHQSTLGSISNSYSFKNLVITLSGAMLLALLSGVMIFMMLTRRLKNLTSRVSQNALALTNNVEKLNDPSSKNAKLDEIDQLTQSYQSMANKLVYQYEELEGNDANRREFIANISHDLRTPLTTMQSYLETLLIKDNSLTSAEKQDYLQIAYRQSKHLRKLVAQLFTLTKLESGEVNPLLERFSLLELAHDTAQEFQIKARSRGVHLSIKPDSDLGSEFDIHADIGMIHRVLENLVGNAIRHTPSGGEVLICIERTGLNYINLAITDTGCGMTHEQCKQVMQRYYTSAGDSDGIGGQSGLGLAIVKTILALHSATMNIESEPGKGTTIQFRLATFKRADDLKQHSDSTQVGN